MYNASLPDVDSYNISDFAHFSLNKGLRLFQLNTQSINNLNRFDNLLCFIDSFKHAFDVIVLSESWLNYDDCHIYSILGFTAIHSCRQGFAGGLSVYVSFSCDCKIIEILDNDFFL